MRVACTGEPATAILSRYGSAWASETGGKVEIVLYDAAAGPEAGSASDLWVVPPAQMPHWANAGRLHPIPAQVATAHQEYEWENILPVYRNKLLIWDQLVYALPLLGDELLCFYRQDLLQDSQHRTAFQQKYGRELSAPASWQEYAEIAEYFNDQCRPGLDRPCPSLPPLPAADLELDREFYALATSFARRVAREDDPKPPTAQEFFSFHYDLGTGEPRIQTAAFVHALRLLQRLQAYRPIDASAQPANNFREGESVLCLTSPAWISRFQEKLGSRFALCRMPGSNQVLGFRTQEVQVVAGSNFVPYLGAAGWVGVVPRSNPNPDAAFALLAFLSSPRISRDIVIEPSWGGGVFRRDHLNNVAWEAFGLDRKKTETMIDLLRETVAHPQVKNPVVRLRIPDEREHQQALAAEIRAALLNAKDAGQALADAAERWRQIDRRKDLKTRLAEYRLSLNLDRSDK